MESDRAFYFLGLAFLALVLLAARAFRRNRSGRVLIAARDNQRAAPAYSINLARTRLAAFAVSGAFAGLAGALMAYNQGAVDAPAYGIFNSITIFLITVIGGLTALSGAIYGVLVIYGSAFFIQPVLERVVNINHIELLFTGPGLILGLLTLPGGYAEALFSQRDKFLRRIAAKHDILVPSLVADRRVEELAEAAVVEHAEEHVLAVSGAPR